MKFRKMVLNSLFLGAGIVGTGLYTTASNVYAAIDNMINTNNASNSGMSEYDYTQRQETENAFHAAGLTNVNMAEQLFNVKDSKGEEITSDKITSIEQTGGNINIKLEYKDDELGNQLASVFGENTVALQNYITNTGSNNISDLQKNLSSVISLRDQIMDLNKQLGAYNQTNTSSSGQNQIIITGDLIKVIASNSGANGGMAAGNSELLSKLNDLLNEFQKLTGLDNLCNLKPSDINIVLAQLNSMQDASLVLTPSTKTYFALNKIVISAKDSKGNIVNISPNQLKTEELLNKYASSTMRKFRNITGKTCPTVTSIGGGKYEINFLNDIKNTNNAVNNIINKWVCSNEGFENMIPAAAFTCSPTSDEVTVNLTLYADKYVYKEKISTGIYPTGTTLQTSAINDNFNYTHTTKNSAILSEVRHDENNYKWENYNKSFYYSKRIKGFKKWTNEPIYDNKYTKTINKSYSVNVTEEVKYVKWDEEKKKQVTVKGKVWNLVTENSVKFPHATYASLDKNKPLISTDDGTYVRNVWFKSQQIRYWDYKEEPKTGTEVYPQWVITKYNTTELANKAGEKYLVSFPNKDKKVSGYIQTKARSQLRLPDASKVAGESIQENRPVKTWSWKMAPLNGEIWIPVVTQNGSVNGTISGADYQIDTN